MMIISSILAILSMQSTFGKHSWDRAPHRKEAAGRLVFPQTVRPAVHDLQFLAAMHWQWYQQLLCSTADPRTPASSVVRKAS